MLQDIVPIAVFITLDIVKTAQAKFIDNDLRMKDSDGGAAEARTSNLNEELGCVSTRHTPHTSHCAPLHASSHAPSLPTPHCRCNTSSATKQARSHAIK
jgi:hypothetical protein